PRPRGRPTTRPCPRPRGGRQTLQRRARIPRPPPRLEAEVARDETSRDIAGAARDCAARMAGRAGEIKIRQRRAIAEMVVHDLLGVEGAREDVAVAHVDELGGILSAGVDVLPESV